MTTTTVRSSPSGPLLTLPGSVLSVFGRAGAVVAVSGDYDTDQVDNASSVAGANASDALETLSTSDGINNGSGVSGSSVTDALNTLLVGVPSGPGAFSESFCGGTAVSVTASTTNGNIGNLAWNYVTFGTATGNSCQMLAGEVGAIGIRRIVSPSANGAGANVYLGSSAVSLLDASLWGSCTWRARFDSTQGANEKCQIGFMSLVNAVLGANDSAGFFGQLAGSGSSPNFQTVTSLAGAGNTPQDTGVAIDDQFHDFKMRHPDSDTVEFFIDGVLVTTHSTGNGDGIPNAGLNPIAGAVGGGSTTFTDVDDFTFAPTS
jgi:hypothetical protein